ARRRAPGVVQFLGGGFCLGFDRGEAFDTEIGVLRASRELSQTFAQLELRTRIEGWTLVTRRLGHCALPNLDGALRRWDPGRRITTARHPQSASERFERSLHDVVGVAPRTQMEMQIHPRLHDQRLEELLDQVAVERADPAALDRREVVDEVGPPAEVDR